MKLFKKGKALYPSLKRDKTDNVLMGMGGRREGGRDGKKTDFMKNIFESVLTKKYELL